MKEKPTFSELLKCAGKTIPYIVEGVVLGFTNQLVNRMETLRLSRSGLASRLGTTPAYVTKLLGGGTNFSVESMVKITEALDAELKIEIVPKTSPEAWVLLAVEKTASMPNAEIRAWSSMHRKRADEMFVGPRFVWPPQLELAAAH